MVSSMAVLRDHVSAVTCVAWSDGGQVDTASSKKHGGGLFFSSGRDSMINTCLISETERTTRRSKLEPMTSPNSDCQAKQSGCYITNQSGAYYTLMQLPPTKRHAFETSSLDNLAKLQLSLDRLSPHVNSSGVHKRKKEYITVGYGECSIYETQG
jgi:hypothetical protein